MQVSLTFAYILPVCCQWFGAVAGLGAHVKQTFHFLVLVNENHCFEEGSGGVHFNSCVDYYFIFALTFYIHLWFSFVTLVADTLDEKHCWMILNSALEWLHQYCFFVVLTGVRFLRENIWQAHPRVCEQCRTTGETLWIWGAPEELRFSRYVSGHIVFEQMIFFYHEHDLDFRFCVAHQICFGFVSRVCSWDPVSKYCHRSTGHMGLAWNVINLRVKSGGFHMNWDWISH